MTHNSRCAYAKSPPSQCRCSCEGSGHGSGGRNVRSKEIRRMVSSSPLTSCIIPNLAIKGAAGMIAPVFPAIIPIYGAYNLIKIGKSIYEAYAKSSKGETSFSNMIKEPAKYAASEISKKVSEEKAGEIAKDIRFTAEAAGVISQIKINTKIDEKIYGAMLEGSIKSGILEGIGSLASYTIGGLVN